LPALLVVAIFGLAMATAAACGNGGDEASPSPEAAASPTLGPPGSIIVSSSPISGQNGKMLLVLAGAENDGPVARICIPIGADSLSLPPTAMTDMPSGQDPCSGSTALTTFSSGTYTVTAGIYAPPASEPEKESTQTVEVSGDASAEVTIDGAALSQ
jgi:hypothetical protein